MTFNEERYEGRGDIYAHSYNPDADLDRDRRYRASGRVRSRGRAAPRAYNAPRHYSREVYIPRPAGEQDASETPDTEENEPPVKREGFADLTEIQGNSMLGSDVEVIPTSEYCPKPRQKTEKTITEEDKYALLVRRFVGVDSDGQHYPDGSELCIQSETLCEAFRDIVKDSYNSLDIESTPIIVPGPFYSLFFKRKEIESFVLDATKPQELRDEVKLLDDFFKEDRTTIRDMKEYEALLAKGKVSVENIWTLYPPNELLVKNHSENPEFWLCRDYHFQSVVGLCLGFDGWNVGLTEVSLPLNTYRSYGKVLEISQLPLVPISYYSGESEARELVIKRGNAFRKIMGDKFGAGYAYQNYSGGIWRDSHTWSYEESEINERCVVDYQKYLDIYRDRLRPNILISLKPLKGGMKRASYVPNHRRTAPRGVVISDRHVRELSPLSSDASSDYGYRGGRFNSRQTHQIDEVDEADEADEADEISTPTKDRFEELLEDASKKFRMIKTMDDLLLLCPARIPGYRLQAKKWAWLLIDNLSDIEFSGKPFTSLQMDAGKKMLIEALVKGHRLESGDRFDDFITGKGKGLVVLLHGSPGIGKTLTAESLAEHIGCPLYMVTGGELSVEVETVESRLKEIFALAKRWKAVVLLDEADVIMMKRRSMELQRSAIVAVWLRLIEYFEGILFLTTNRFGDCDEAFKSRINLTIQLPELDAPQRTQIWRGLIEGCPSAVEVSLWGESAFTSLGQLDINGRVIKNILRTATCYARAERKKLSLFHIRAVIKVELSGLENIDQVMGELEELDLKA